MLTSQVIKLVLLPWEIWCQGMVVWQIRREIQRKKAVNSALHDEVGIEGLEFGQECLCRGLKGSDN